MKNSYINKMGQVIQPKDLEKTIDEINEMGGGAPYVEYTTTAPTEANTQGLKFVVLSAEPATKYSGYMYLIVGG